MSCQAVTNGYKCGKGTVNISAIDPGLVAHSWIVDGINESAAAQFQKTLGILGFVMLNQKK